MLWSAPVRDLLLRIAEQGLFVPAWSQQVLDEMASSLSKRRPDLGPNRIEHLVAELQRAFPGQIIHGYEHLIPTMLNQEKDRHVLAAAVFARANILVTWNTKDFPTEATQPHDVTVQTPDQFLCDIWQDNQARLIELLRQQADDTRDPPLTLDGIIHRLRLRVPNFGESAAQFMLEL